MLNYSRPNASLTGKFLTQYILINRGLVGMLMTLVLLILSALDVIFFFLPSPIDPKPVARYGEQCPLNSTLFCQINKMFFIVELRGFY